MNREHTRKNQSVHTQRHTGMTEEYVVLETTSAYNYVTYATLYAYAVSLVSISQIVDFLVSMMNRGRSPLVAEINQLSKDRGHLLKERDAISAQDQYAKWTKLNRRIDKLDAEIAQKSKNFKDDSKNLNAKLNTIVSALLRFPQYIIILYFSRKPVIEINYFNSLFGTNTWYLWFINFCLRFPFGANNTISGSVWSFIITTVLKTAVKSLTALYTLCLSLSNTKAEAKPKNE